MRTVNEMNELHVIMDGLRSEVELVITGLSRFTSVMQAISDIKKMAIQAEVCYTMCQVFSIWCTLSRRLDLVNIYLRSIFFKYRYVNKLFILRSVEYYPMLRFFFYLKLEQ